MDDDPSMGNDPNLANDSMIEEVHLKIAQAIADSQRILVTSHIRPDADAVGSVLGLGLALINSGKSVQMVLADGADQFGYLPGSGLIRQSIDEVPEMVIVVDCSDPARAGTLLVDYGQPDLVVDHHKTNLAFGKFNVVETEQVATAAIIFDHLPTWGLRFDAQVATCLLAGIVGDTIGFRTPNVDADLLRRAADLMDFGADLTLVYQEELVLKSLSAVRYWGAGLNRLECDRGLVWTSLTLDDREKIGYPISDDADLVNVLSSIREAQIALIFVEQPNQSIKVSWRTGPDLDVSEVAFHFGGGGHAAAAGADIAGTLSDVKNRVITKTLELINNKDD